MPNTLDQNGLVVKTSSEILEDLSASLKSLYGSDIALDSDTPDGQLINVFTQVMSDLLELLLDTYNSFSVENAYGAVLDSRVALNGITRRQGTYTQVNLSVTATLALTLTGQDALLADPTASPFTVQDNAGNQFQLVTTNSFSGAATHTLLFQAVNIGQVQVSLNTITNQVTTVRGISGVNNPSAPTQVGINEETDAQLKIRHAKSFALAATGPADAVYAALLELADVSDAYVVENATNGTVGGVPANSIWCIVTGGADADIAQAIYAKKGIGCGMRGSRSHNVTRPNGTIFQALWDASITENLHIKFTISAIVAGTSFDYTAIKTALVAAMTYKLNQLATVGDIVTAMLKIQPDAYMTVLGVSTDGASWLDSVAPSDAQHYFLLATSRITIAP